MRLLPSWHTGTGPPSSARPRNQIEKLTPGPRPSSAKRFVIRLHADLRWSYAPCEVLTKEPDMPRIVRFHQTGGPEVLKIAEEPLVQPRQGEVRLRVQALGLNRAEAMFRSGAYLETPQF